MFFRFSFPFCSRYEASETDARNNWKADFHDTRKTRILQDRDTGNRSPGIIPRKALSSKHLLLTEEISCTSLIGRKKIRDLNRSGTPVFMPPITPSATKLACFRHLSFNFRLISTDSWESALGNCQRFGNMISKLGMLLS